ncbi:hypothetical protein HD554DRAFT_2093560 [Boletus coccyginus]|nr:hypothetical protein HD554DRAFT_2093560 [Boletus coccyginus]
MALRLVVPPHPKLPPGSQHAQLPSDISHKGEEQWVNNQPPTRADGVGHGIARSRSFASATRMEKDPLNVEVDLENQGPSHGAGKSRRESTLRTVLTAVSGYFKRPQTRNVVAVAGVHPEFDQLRREILALEKRCADLEGANHAECGSCRSSTLNLFQGLRQPNAEISQCTVSLSEDSECNRVTTMQADVTSLETNIQAVPARQGPVQVPVRAEGQVGAKDLNIQPTVAPRAAKAEPSSPLDQNWAGKAPATQDTTVVRADLEGLARKDQVFAVEFAQTGQQKPTRNEDEELNAKAMVEFEAQPGYIDQERLPRKKRGNEGEELEAETPLPRVYQERLPRRREKGRKGEREAARAETSQSSLA